MSRVSDGMSDGLQVSSLSIVWMALRRDARQCRDDVVLLSEAFVPRCAFPVRKGRYPKRWSVYLSLLAACRSTNRSLGIPISHEEDGGQTAREGNGEHRRRVLLSARNLKTRGVSHV
jgi:hypothetical protein